MTPSEWACAQCGHVHEADRACQSVRLGHGQTCNCSSRAATLSKSTHTPARSVRIPEPLWQAAKLAAAEQGETVTDVLTEALRRYVRRHR